MTLNSYWISRDPSRTARIFSALRGGSSDSSGYPTTLGAWTLSSLRDVTKGYDSSEVDGKLRLLPIDANAEMISFSLMTQGKEAGVDGLIGTIRTSGTEPKIKYYLEGWGSNGDRVKMALERVRQAIAQDWMKVEEEGLEAPQ